MKKIVKAVELCQSGVVACRQQPILDGNSCEILLLGDTYNLLQLHNISFQIVYKHIDGVFLSCFFIKR